MTALANLLHRVADKVDHFLADIFDEDSRAGGTDMRKQYEERSRVSWRKSLNNLS